MREDVPATGTALIFGEAQRAEASLGLTNVDTRLKADDRLTQFQERGGRFVVEQVDPERLDSIAAGHDLTLVATGRGGLSSLFPVDASRRVYDRPHRRLLMLSVAGLGHGPDVFRPPATGRWALQRVLLHYRSGQGEAGSAPAPADAILERFSPAGRFARSGLVRAA